MYPKCASSGPENPRTACIYKDKETARVGLAKTECCKGEGGKEGGNELDRPRS